MTEANVRHRSHFSLVGAAWRMQLSLLWELIEGRAAAVEAEQDFIWSSLSPGCFLEPHPWCLEAWLSSVALPPVTALTSSLRSQASWLLWLTGAQLSGTAGGFENILIRGHCYSCRAQWKINAAEPQRKDFCSDACNIEWGGANLNLIMLLEPFSFLV